MYGMVLPRFVEAAVGERTLQVYGDGNQTRCFCHVADVVEALVKLMSTPETVGQVYNLGNDEEISMNDLAKRVIEVAGSKSTIEHIPYEKAYGQKFDDMMRRVPSVDKIRAAIGWKPRQDLNQIIRSVVDQYRQQPRG